MTDSIFGAELEVIKAEPVSTAKPKMAIKNVADLSDEALRKKLRDKGVDVTDDATRGAMILAAKASGLWDYKGNILNVNKKREYASKGGNCGDAVATAFGPLTDSPEGLKTLQDVAVANDIKFDRWAHCNFGQKKMNLGNVLRGKIKRGEYVIINTTEFNLPEADEQAQA